MANDWLPDLILREEYSGDWERFIEAVYQAYSEDFEQSKPSWPHKPVSIKWFPIRESKNSNFWHITRKGEVEAEREFDEERCERIKWPKAIIETFPDRPPQPTDPIKWWRNQRGRERNVLLSLPDFSYLVIMRERRDYILFWTAYPIEYKSQRRKQEREFNAYWTER